MALSGRPSLAHEIEKNMRTIFRRCVICPTEAPTCPDCPNGQICSLVPADCNSCSYMTCIPNPSPAPPSSGPNVGAVAGGVIGGLVFMAIIVFFLWRFRIKKKREQQEMEAEWEEDEIAQQKGFSALRADNASTKTRGSIANSILSRASNIIQIAYIPGVTNRNGSSHNSMLANTPVPPIPAQYRNPTPKSPLSNEGDVLFFRPGSLRGSTYSDGSSIRSGNNRDTQYTRQSITPSLARSSMMSGMSSDVYMDDASAEPMPSGQLLRGLPRMVSVKGSPAISPGSSKGNSPNPGSIKVSVIGQNSGGSSPRSAPSFQKATQVTVGKGKGRFPIAQQGSDSPASNHAPSTSSPLVETATDSDDEDEHARARRSLIQATARAADPAPLIQPLESPFFDASEAPTPATGVAASRPNPYAAMSSNVVGGRRRANSRGPGGLSAVMEEAAKRASQDPEQESIATANDPSPFSDAHETK